MRRTPIQCFRASTTVRVSRPPLIQIKGATFYRRQPAVEPTEEDDLTNRPLFPNLDFEIPAENVSQQYWAVCGPSNAGKTTFLEILRGQHLCFPPNARKYPYLSSEEIEAKDPRLRYPGRAIQYVGFDTKERGLSGMGTYLSARYESRREVTDFSVSNFLKGNTQLNALATEEPLDAELFARVVEDMRLGNLLDMPLSNLSNGQTRRTRIARALLGKPELLLLDEPFMGLDPPTMRTLSPILHRLASMDTPRLLLSLRPQDPIPDWITHLVYLGDDLKVKLQGPKEKVNQALLEKADAFGGAEKKLDTQPGFFAEFGQQLTDSGIVSDSAKDDKVADNHRATLQKPQSEWDDGKSSRALRTSIRHKESVKKLHSRPQRPHYVWRHAEPQTLGEPVIEMEGVAVKYGDKPILGNWTQKVDTSKDVKKGLWWTVQRGQRWGVFGPNGSGKTTLLSLILSDHPQSYSAPMKIFGRSRLPSPGRPGVSVFELQRRIGHSSPEVHGFFPRHLTVRQTLESAYADTPLGKPTLSVEADERISACLRWFQGELNPPLGMNFRLKEESLRGGRAPSQNRIALRGNAEVYKEIVSTEQYELDQKMAESIEWADDMLFGGMPFSAQRVALFLRAIVAQPDIVILDEAFSGMDDYIRDKCLLFLDYGESMRLPPYDPTQAHVYDSDNYGAITRFTSDMQEYYVIKEGLTANQALVVVSHVKEEIPASVRDWIFLPESETGEPCVIGKVFRRSLKGDDNLWDQIWGLIPLEKRKGEQNWKPLPRKKATTSTEPKAKRGRPRKVEGLPKQASLWQDQLHPGPATDVAAE